MTGIKPLEYRVLVKLDGVETVTRGGIFLPPAARESLQFSQEKGTLIAKGGLAFEDFPKEEQELLVPGTRIMFSKYAGVKVRGADGNEYQLGNDKDVTAILTEEVANEL